MYRVPTADELWRFARTVAPITHIYEWMFSYTWTMDMNTFVVRMYDDRGSFRQRQFWLSLAPESDARKLITMHLLLLLIFECIGYFRIMSNEFISELCKNIHFSNEFRLFNIVCHVWIVVVLSVNRIKSKFKMWIWSNYAKSTRYYQKRRKKTWTTVRQATESAIVVVGQPNSSIM